MFQMKHIQCEERVIPGEESREEEIMVQSGAGKASVKESRRYGEGPGDGAAEAAGCNQQG